MVRQHYRRCFRLSQARTLKTPVRACPFPPGGGRAALNEAALRRRSRGERAWRPCADAVAPRLGWGGSAGEGVYSYRLWAAGIGLLAALLVAIVLCGAAHGDDELVRY